LIAFTLMTKFCCDYFWYLAVLYLLQIL